MKFWWTRPAAAAVAGFFCCAVSPAVSQEISEFRDHYALTVRSIPVGEFRIAGRTDGRSYSAAGLVFSTGLVSVFAKFSIRAGVRGWVRGSGLRPFRYHNKVTRGSGDVKSQVVNFKSGRPWSVELDPPDDSEVDPRSSAVIGAIDPLSMGFLTFRPTEKVALCDRDYKIFDGRRLLTISLKTVSASDNQVTCAGTYNLLLGFTPEERERDRSDFTVVFQKDAGSGGLFRLQNVSTRISFGTFKMERIN